MKKIIGSTFLITVLLIGLVIFLEPQASFGAFVDDQVIVTQVVTEEISIDSPADVDMSPDIPGMTGGNSDGNCTWTVITNNLAGFNMGLTASTTPAMQDVSANSFADYTPAGAPPDFDWSVAAADSEFGFSPYGTTTPANVAAAFKYTGTTCNSGTTTADGKCWRGFNGATAIPVFSRSTPTTSSGEAEKINYKATSGASHFQIAGTYHAYITATATTN